ncbi:MAG: glucose-6-phosphate dehydrogenase [Alphaproteobacteria bacterium]|nr:glucose-6-phosphate dehydrogenase [Alphaproteobacteria bacterium]
MSLSRQQAEGRKRAYEPAPACTMVIFGAGGDLTKRLIMPALYNLSYAHMLPDDFRVIGIDIAEFDDESWRKHLTDTINSFVGKPGAEFSAQSIDAASWQWLMQRLQYRRGDFGDPETFRSLGGLLDERGNRLFYLAVADRFFGPLVESLGEAGLVKQEPDGPWRRVVVEKPFGHDLASALALNAQILRVLDERQVFRMDHFLGKETVQNIMMLRFGNGAFESVWNRDHIEYVQITAAETVGVEGRGGFYEHAGALRDMVPNHMFQLLTVTAMEPPYSFDAEAVRDEKAKVLHAVHGLEGDGALHYAVRGQYGAGTVLGKPANAYRAEPHVDPNSRTETYVALRLMIDNWRWAGVPFYVRTGKHLQTRRTEIVVNFRRPPFRLFRDTPTEELATNQMVLHIQPDDGISLHFNAKVPGPHMDARDVRMDFRYKDYFSEIPSTGYEILLYDCMVGDATLFQRADFVEAGWRVVQPLLDAWQNTAPASFPNYASGSEGPAAAAELLQRDGHSWRSFD